MRIAVLSDIHSNHSALQAILAHARDCRVDDFWCLGDVTGYGPEPSACVRVLRERFGAWVTGNHEAILRDLLSLQSNEKIYLSRDRLQDTIDFVYNQWKGSSNTSRRAIAAMLLNLIALNSEPELLAWYREQISDPRQNAPRAINLPGAITPACVLVHGTLQDPLTGYANPWDNRDFYIRHALFDSLASYGENPVLFFGHSHVPVYFQLVGNEVREVEIEYGRALPLNGHPAAVNPGSAGRPGDLDHRAAYAILDTQNRTITFLRVEYRYRETTNLMGAYPQDLVEETYTARLRAETNKDGRYPDEIEKYLPLLEQRKGQPGGSCHAA